MLLYYSIWQLSPAVDTIRITRRRYFTEVNVLVGAPKDVRACELIRCMCVCARKSEGTDLSFRKLRQRANHVLASSFIARPRHR